MRKFVIIYLIISACLSLWFASGLIVSGGHLSTYLGDVCPESLPDSALAKRGIIEHHTCPKLVSKIKSINRMGTKSALFLLCNFVFSILVVVTLRYIFIKSDEDTNEKIVITSLKIFHLKDGTYQVGEKTFRTKQDAEDYVKVLKALKG